MSDWSQDSTPQRVPRSPLLMTRSFFDLSQAVVPNASPSSRNSTFSVEGSNHGSTIQTTLSQTQINLSPFIFELSPDFRLVPDIGQSSLSTNPSAHIAKESQKVNSQTDLENSPIITSCHHPTDLSQEQMMSELQNANKIREDKDEDEDIWASWGINSEDEDTKFSRKEEHEKRVEATRLALARNYREKTWLDDIV